MENILEFLENNYIWFLVAAGVLLLALIGVIVDSKRKQKKMEGNFDKVDNSVQPELESSPAPMPMETNDLGMESAPETFEQPSMEPVQNTFSTEPMQMNPGMGMDNSLNNFNTPEVNEVPETVSFEPAPSTSESMTFNDVPSPTVEEPITTPEVKEEIVQPFDFGNPVVMEEPTVEPVQTFETPVANNTFNPVQEPAVQINEAPVVNPAVESQEEPVITIE